MEEIFKLRILYTPTRSIMVNSYVEDGTIMTAEATKMIATELMVEILQDCNRIANPQGMSFEQKKTAWMGIGKENWPDIITDKGLIKLAKR